MLDEIAAEVWSWFWNYKIHLSLAQDSPIISMGQIVILNIVISFVGTATSMIGIICLDPNFEPKREKIREWVKKLQ